MNDVLFGSISDPARWVYHYTSLRVALECILPSGRLKAGPFSGVRDPRESKSWFFSVGWYGDKGPGQDELFRLAETATSMLKGTCKVLCMSQDHPRAAMDAIDCVLHRGYARPRMWAQYGDGHSGVCLMFDRAALDLQIRSQFSSESVYSGPVEYVNRAVDEPQAFHFDGSDIGDDNLESAVQAKVAKYNGIYFFTKAEDWSSETEWRWVIRGTNCDPEYIPIGDSLEAIVLGDDLPQVYEPAIIPFGERYQAPVARICWRNGRPVATPVWSPAAEDGST